MTTVSMRELLPESLESVPLSLPEKRMLIHVIAQALKDVLCGVRPEDDEGDPWAFFFDGTFDIFADALDLGSVERRKFIDLAFRNRALCRRRADAEVGVLEGVA